MLLWKVIIKQWISHLQCILTWCQKCIKINSAHISDWANCYWWTSCYVSRVSREGFVYGRNMGSLKYRTTKTETPKKFRVCIDPSQTINKVIERPVYQMPTLPEQLHKLSRAKCFSLADVREGFLHLPLDDESSYLTTMHTSYGRYRWTRLPFGISSAPEEFQMRLNPLMTSVY